MSTKSVLWALIVTSGVILAIDAAAAQGMQDRMGAGMMHDSARQGQDRGMMQGGMGMGQCMMHGGMGSEMGQQMGRGMMGSGMMGSGMMRGGMRSGMGALFGSRVTPVMNLSVDDVRGYLASQLDRLNNKRLKLGDIKKEDGTITADVVTVDNSLVQRLKVDPHTGTIDYEN
ncbi:hypothetical protein V1277_006504 [Bradyrhizobium sp. AZCC 1588]|uniref:hypothetical protein n=1 Tax=unclassified Bradyrhizobium TaxID=2631580 RepID=UPI002FEF84D9